MAARTLPPNILENCVAALKMKMAEGTIAASAPAPPGVSARLAVKVVLRSFWKRATTGGVFAGPRLLFTTILASSILWIDIVAMKDPTPESLLPLPAAVFHILIALADRDR